MGGGGGGGNDEEGGNHDRKATGSYFPCVLQVAYSL